MTVTMTLGIILLIAGIHPTILQPETLYPKGLKEPCEKTRKLLKVSGILGDRVT